MGKLIDIHPQNPQSRLIMQAAILLVQGGVIVYPTDTIYGIGCAISKKNAIERVVAIKGRDPKKPLSIVCDTISRVSDYAIISKFAYRILRHCLPGPYTFVLPSTSKVPKMLLTRQKTIGIRIPNHPVPLALVEAINEPIIGTSANRSNEDVITDPQTLEAQLGPHTDMILSAGTLPIEPSSVISLVGDQVEILRHGSGDLDFFKCLSKS